MNISKTQSACQLMFLFLYSYSAAPDGLHKTYANDPQNWQTKGKMTPLAQFALN
jgi:hypothetical protein